MGIMVALGVGFIAMGVAAMAAGAAVLLRARREAASRISAWGVVAALQQTTAIAGFIYCPVVRFQTENGQAVTFQSSMGGQPPLHSVGQRVAVFYDRARPQGAELEAPAVLWMVPAGIFGAGFLFAAMGAALVLLVALAALS